MLVYFIIVDRAVQVGQIRAEADGFQSFWEFADGSGIVVFFDVLSGAGNRHAVQKLKEIKIEHLEQRVRRALFRLQVAPFVESALCLTEDFINGFLRIQLLFEYFRVTLVGQCKLIAQIEKSIVDRRCRKHQHLRLYARAYDLAHQNLVAIFAVALMRTDAAFAIAEVM